MKIKIVSLKTAIKRRELLDENLKWLDYEYFDAIDFREKSYPLEKKFNFVPQSKDFSRGALGCLLSHRALWKELITSELSYMIILEDDVSINQVSYNKILEKIDHITSNYDIFFFGANNGNSIPKLFCKIKLVNNNSFIAEPIEKYLYGTYGYLVTRKGASILLEHSRFGLPVDYWSVYKSKSNVKYGCVYPNVIIPSLMANISDTEPLKKIIRRNSTYLIFKTLVINTLELLKLLLKKLRIY